MAGGPPWVHENVGERPESSDLLLVAAMPLSKCA
jgi:hypothetical protein